MVHINSHYINKGAILLTELEKKEPVSVVKDNNVEVVVDTVIKMKN